MYQLFSSFTLTVDFSADIVFRWSLLNVDLKSSFLIKILVYGYFLLRATI